jgi:hypothetical protein
MGCGDHQRLFIFRGVEMGVQPWMIKSWPLVDMQVSESNNAWPKFWHANTTVLDLPSDGVVARGDTVWLGEMGRRQIAVAFEWAELREGVVALADQNWIVSNIRPLRADKTYQEHLEALISFNRLAHALAWQPVVSAVLGALRTLPRSKHHRRVGGDRRNMPSRPNRPLELGNSMAAACA